MAVKSNLRSEVARLQRTHRALIVIAISAEEVAFAIDSKLSTRDAEETVLGEIGRVMHEIAEQRRQRGRQ